MIDVSDFDYIKIGLASTKDIQSWSSGEVTKPETINYRTLKPEKDGLFCERIFGPTRDWECYCGKYKRVRYKGIICERCGVEVTRQKVRRERMGHIDLAAPVSHIWFFKGVPSRIGYLLDIAPKDLEKVLYFAAHICTNVDEEARAADLSELERKVVSERDELEAEREGEVGHVAERLMRRRKYIATATEDGFDDDDEYWARMLNAWAEEQGFSLAEDRLAAGGLLAEIAIQLTDTTKKVVGDTIHRLAVREDRNLTPKEIDAVAAVAADAIDILKEEIKRVREGKGAQKSAGRRALEASAAFLAGDDSAKDAEALAEKLTGSTRTRKELDKARGLGNGLLADVVRLAPDVPAKELDVKELTNDLCLKASGKMTREDHRRIEEWTAKITEMLKDAEQRKKDGHELYDERLEMLDLAWQKFQDIKPKEVIGDEKVARELKDRFASTYGFGEYIGLGMGAEAVRDLLSREDIPQLVEELKEMIATGKGQKQQRAIKRLKVVSAFHKSEQRPDWMILEVIPVIPPELRPMVQLDGGRFATSDLNDLYRRVINRNNRLKRLLDLGAPEIIVNNEKRMLQEAVDALFDNGRRGRAVTGPGNRPLKSLSDMLKGKQGRFRQNLLGKRVDYSGRSVIVAGPQLKLQQCGLPKLMALELFKPFIMSRLVERKAVPNIKAAKRMVETREGDVWDVLEEVITEHPVLLNRAPTLHRLGIQAFEPVLVDGKAIQVHPLVCHAFNADFDGDQMAVHVPLSVEAQAEARLLMLSAHNILSPANGRPLATPSQDMVIGLYYLTYSSFDSNELQAKLDKGASSKDLGSHGTFATAEEVQVALDHKRIPLQGAIILRGEGGVRKVTTPGRAILNYELRLALQVQLGRELDEDDVEEVTTALTKREITDFVTTLVDRHGPSEVAMVLDTIKDLGFKYATQSGVSISKNDIVTPPQKQEILKDYEKRVQVSREQYDDGLITEQERHRKVVQLWNEATDAVGEQVKDGFSETNPVYMMANSGARGSFKQIRQLAGMRGLMANPKGEIIERPIKANFMEGLDVLEYFISTHGARKGLADTALRTADSGYLTRRLVDVSQDVIVREEDCGTERFVEVPAFMDRRITYEVRSGAIVRRSATLDVRPSDQLAGRVLALDVTIGGGETLPSGTPISRSFAQELYEEKFRHVEAALVKIDDEVKKAGKEPDPIALAKAVGLTDLAEVFKRENKGEDPYFTLEAIDDMKNPEKFLRRLEEEGYPSKPHADRTPEEVRILQIRTLTWALNEKVDAECTVPVRSVLTCNAEIGVCGACYGVMPATGSRSEVGDAVGIIAAQSIGEPGTQLTMRTFHTGGVAGSDITHGLPRVVELFEARTPKMPGAVAHVDGRVIRRAKLTGQFVFVLPLRDDIEVREVKGEGTVIFYRGERMTRTLHEWLTKGIPYSRSAEEIVEDGQIVVRGQQIVNGVLAAPDLMATGLDRATRYLTEEVQRVYRDQGVEINDKHIEVIARQMTRRVLVDFPGDTDYLPGQLVEVSDFVANRAALEKKAAKVKKTEVPTGEQQVLGITKASLATESFLSAASFQETTKVLTDASIEGKTDHLLGLKENVIIGKLIPASTGLKQYRNIEIEPREPWTPEIIGIPEFDDDLGIAGEEIEPMIGLEERFEGNSGLN
jgi:DNA-directed RNA polymerase subunit beta'